MIISIVGSRDTGKSHFVGVIINELRNRISVGFDASLEGATHDSMRRYKESFEHHLYGSRRTLPLTQSSLVNTDNGAFRPLIFSLKTRPTGTIQKFFSKIQRKDTNSYTFVFFDTAGEDLNSEDTMSTVNKYIYNSAGIILLLDPLKIPAVRHGLMEQNLVKNSSSVELGSAEGTDDIMTRVSNIIRNALGLKKDQKIDIPLAAVFSKFDVLIQEENFIPPELTICGMSPHCAKGVFDMTDLNNVNAEVQSLLAEWGEEYFINQLKMNYNKYSFFAVSALGLGNAPDGTGSISRPNPHRIEDPLLWLLKENGVIKGK